MLKSQLSNGQELKGFLEGFYNPDQRLELEALEAIKRPDRRRVIFSFSEFNAHSTLWGGDRTDRKGLAVEHLMDSLRQRLIVVQVVSQV